jgi:peptide/nickel transport system substrate-binding protein
MAAWLQQSWAEVGLDAEIEKLEWRQFRERRIAHQFDAAMGGVSMTPNPDLHPLYHSAATDQMNYGSFADAEVDRLIESGRTTFDPAERLRAIRSLDRRLFELQPAAWLFNFPSPLLHDRRLQGIRPSAVSHFTTTEGPRVWRWVEAPTAQGS